MIKGQEYHSIIQGIFGDVNGLNISSQLQVNCPRCMEREGLTYPDGKFNLEINTAKRVFRCWKCDEPKFSGSLKTLIRLYGSYADYELYKSFIGSIDFYEHNDEDEEVEEQQVKLPDEMILFSNMEVGNPDHFEAYNYLINDRKLTRDIILKYRLGFCVTGKYAKRIIIPSFDKDGDVNYFVGRYYGDNEFIKKKNPYDNPKSDKDKIIFNEGLVNWDSTVYLVEGVFDMLSFPVNIIPMLGKTISTTLFFKLKEFKPNVVVLLDPDAYKSSIDLYYMLETIYAGSEEKVKIVKLPTNDDLDELRKREGIDTVIKSLYTARDLVVDDYFVTKLNNPNDRRRKERYYTNSKHLEWKSGSTRNHI